MNKIFYPRLDSARLVMALMVVGIHADFLVKLSNGFFVNGIFRIAVPFFFVSSGFFFGLSWKNNLHKIWIGRHLRLYFVWTLLYAFFWLEHFSQNSLLRNISFIFLGYGHLWYLPAVIISAIFTLFFPLTRFFPFFILVLFSIGYLLQLESFGVSVFSLSVAPRLNYYRNFLFFCLPFFYLGFLIANYNLGQRLLRHGKEMAFLGVSLLILESIFFCYLYREGMYVDMTFSSFILAPLLFLFCLNKTQSKSSPQNSRLSAYIYFTHYFFVLELGRFFNGDLLLFLVSLSCTVALSYVMVRVRIFDKFLI